MPLVDIDAASAVEQRKKNPAAGWGDRSIGNRVEPIAMPTFEVPFRLDPGERIFTVGSCFARNVEVELMKRGFKVPIREMFRRKEFLNLDVGIINNFGTPSIYNELAWALGEREFVVDDHVVEVIEGKFADMHVISSVRLDHRETVLARRRAIIEAYRTVRECRVVIMTLGLVEVWFDTKTSYYLNAAPRPSLVRNEPDRFRLHVLSYEEAYRYLEDALLLLRKHGRADMKVILTVSPVPLAATHRQQDVMVANMFSKSVLRCAAEAAVMKHDFVSYYPSYESVILSDRKLAWREDLIHVTDQIVSVNVGRMIDAFVQRASEQGGHRAEIEQGGDLVAVEWARRFGSASRDEAAAFFSEFGSYSRASQEFAIHHAGFHMAGRDYQGALSVLEAAPNPTSDGRLQVMSAQALIKLGRAREAYDKLNIVALKGNKSHATWAWLMEAAKAIGDKGIVQEVLMRWTAAIPRRASRAHSLVGRWLHERGEFETALGYFQSAMALADEDALAKIYFIETLIALGRWEEARRTIVSVVPVTPSEVTLAARLSAKLAVSPAIRSSGAL